MYQMKFMDPNRNELDDGTSSKGMDDLVEESDGSRHCNGKDRVKKTSNKYLIVDEIVVIATQNANMHVENVKTQYQKKKKEGNNRKQRIKGNDLEKYMSLMKIVGNIKTIP